MKNHILSHLFTAAVVALAAASCIRTHNEVEVKPVEVKPVEIKPIHITLDINLKIQQDLDNSFEAIKKATDERKPKLDALKKSGLIGENNQGYIQALDGATLASADEKVIDAENTDRKQIYVKVAERQGSSVEKVGANRAKKLRDRSNAGDYIQQEDGTWTKSTGPVAE